ncbi:hypothetical protein MIND_00582800 [Mycena indigotica]|uniref:Uncharacterized protein n=1 Tax=Mycena indigotica TaxID=2126181 RepID=A0A8H6SRT0_9AGAR|nr:uncharacterized protein MIND_00582800 [Mycena indigotica]KAF7303536.1 hypothetical protein MIND_00582800 [Mycena indigotica]
MLTHLELFMNAAPWMTPLLAAAFPALTHLALFDLCHLDVIKSLLETQPRLAVLAFVYMADQAFWDHDLLRARLAEVGADDPRFAIVGLTDFECDWERGAWGGQDYWCVAEEDIARRRAEKFKSHS